MVVLTAKWIPWLHSLCWYQRLVAREVVSFSVATVNFVTLAAGLLHVATNTPIVQHLFKQWFNSNASRERCICRVNIIHR